MDFKLLGNSMQTCPTFSPLNTIYDGKKCSVIGLILQVKEIVVVCLCF